MKYSYVLQEREHMRFRSREDGPAQFDLMIVGELDYATPTLQAVIDWQDGLSIFHCEDLEPAAWPEIAEQITLALKDAREKMGDNAIWSID